MTRTLRLCLVALALLGAGALTSCSDSGNDVALTVNGTEISNSTIQSEIDDLVDFARACPNSSFAQSIFGQGGDGQDTVSTAFTAQVLQERIVSVIVQDEFERRNLEISDSDKRQAEQQFAQQLGGATCDPNAAATGTTTTTADPAAGQALFDNFSQEFQDFEIRFNAQASVLTSALTSEGQGDSSVTAQDVRDYYDANQAQFTQNCVSHILVDSRDTAEQLRQQILAGADFATVAAANSTDTGSASQGGSLGCQAPGTFVPEFEAAIDDAEVGVVTEPVQTQFGWHLILVESKGLQPFADVKDQIRQQLAQPQSDPLNTFLQDALKDAEVDVNQRYGSWDTDSLAVVPPDGPTTTTAPSGGSGGSGSTATTVAGQPPATDTTTTGG